MFDISVDEDEVQSERDFFWAIAFESINPELNDLWADYQCSADLVFTNIHQILEEFDDHTECKFNPNLVELFVAQRIWVAKCNQDRFANPEFAAFLKLSHLTRWVYAGVN